MITTISLWLAKYAAGRWLQANWAWLKYVLVAVAVVGAFLLYRASLIDHGRALERAEWEARQRAAEAKAQADSWALVGNINQIDTTTIQTVEKIRAVPRDKPRTVAIEVARDLPCLHVPDRLLNATNQYTRDLAAASGHRIDAVPPAGDPEGR